LIRPRLAGFQVTGDTSNGSVDSQTVSFKVRAVAAVREVWVAHFTGQYPAGMVVDRDGNTCVTGPSTGGGDSDYLTVKFDRDGNRLWTTNFNGPGGSSDRPVAIASDAAGNVFVTGTTSLDPAGHYPTFGTVKYDSNGNQVWAVYAPTSAGQAYGLAVDKAGNCYVTGTAYYDAIKGNNYLTVKYDTNGVLAWSARFDGDAAKAILVDDCGNVYVTGGSGTLKYGPDGNQLWATGGPPGDALLFDSAGNVVVAGLGGYIEKVETNGTLIWRTYYNAYVPFTPEFRKTLVALDSAGNIFAAGPSDRNSFGTSKFSQDGVLIWSKGYFIADFGDTFESGMAVDKEGNVYVTGGSSGSLGYHTVKYNAEGTQVWAVQHGNGGYSYAIAVDDDFNLYVVGNELVKYEQHPKLHVLGFSDGQFNLCLSGEPRGPYSLQATTNLTDWTPLASLTATNAAVQFADPDTGDFSHRLYRAVLLP
jgi:hypothetical protein